MPGGNKKVQMPAIGSNEGGLLQTEAKRKASPGVCVGEVEFGGGFERLKAVPL